MNSRPIDKGGLGNRLLGVARRTLSSMARLLNQKPMVTAADHNFLSGQHLIDPPVLSTVFVVHNVRPQVLIEASISTNIHTLQPLRELLDVLAEVELLRMVRMMYTKDRFPVDVNGGYKLVLRKAGQSIAYRFLGKDLLADRGSVEEVTPLLSPGGELYVLGGRELMRDKYFGVSRKDIPLMQEGMLRPGTLIEALELEKRLFADTAGERKETAQRWRKQVSVPDNTTISPQQQFITDEDAIAGSAHKHTIVPIITGPNTAGQCFIRLAQVPEGHSVRNIPFIPYWGFDNTTLEERVEQLHGQMLEMSLEQWPPLKDRRIEGPPKKGRLDSSNVRPFYALADCLHLLFLVEELREYRVAYTSKGLPVDSRGSYSLTYPISNGQEKIYRFLRLRQKDHKSNIDVDIEMLLMQGEQLENIPFHNSAQAQLCFAVSQRKRPTHISSGFGYRKLEEAFEDEYRIFKSRNDGQAK